MNRRGYKFLVEATILNVQLLVHFPCKVQVVIKKGSQKFETQQIYELQQGVAVINENLQFNINATLTQDGNIEENKAQLVVILVTEKGQKSAGFYNLEFSQYLNSQNLEFQETLALDKCPDKKAKLLVNFKITRMAELENDVEINDQSLDLSQVSVITSGQESFTIQNLQKSPDQVLLTEKKLDESGIKQKTPEIENQLLINKDVKINEQNKYIQQLESKINDMVEQEIHQNMINKYEQQLKDQDKRIQSINDDNTQINLQLQAQRLTIERQNEELTKLKQIQQVNSQSKSINRQQSQQSDEQVIQPDLQKINSEKEELKQLNESLVQKIEQINQEIEALRLQVKDKNEQIQNMKNLTSGTISALQQRNLLLEKDLAQQKDINQKYVDQQPINAIQNDKLIEELQSTLKLKQQELDNLQQKYESELAKKDEIVQSLQQKMDESFRKDAESNRLSHESKTQIISSEKQIDEINVRSKSEQQINRLKNQIQIWQSKYESNQKALSDYNSEIQYLQRSVEDVPNFLEDQKELVEPLLLLRRAIQRKLQNYNLTQQHFESRVQQLEQELEVSQYKLKLEQSQQSSDPQFQSQTYTKNDEFAKLKETIEQKNEQLRILQLQIDQQKQQESETLKSSEEAKAQLASMRTNFAKCKQQLAESMQEKVFLQAKLAEQTKALKEKNQEIQKEQDLISELEQYNIQMEEALSQTLDQYKLQNTQMKQAYEKEKKLRSELQVQLKTLKEEYAKASKGELPKAKDAEEKQQQQQCNCKEKIQTYEQKIAELEFQLSDLQLQRLDKAIQRNSIAQIRTSLLVSHRESLAFQQMEDLNTNSNKGNETTKTKELEDQNVNLTDERFKISKEYQTILERALQTNTQIENKYKNQVKELEDKIEIQAQSLVKMKLDMADLYSAAIDIGGAMLVDKLQIALGIRE
ncbi:unnamed protein product (macronuclear) [Paramecium tetraurelia]|uniref:C2 NT-type domain-containing protein n=1 Tax=Paramecium tetraurelia TaxID=5888 RepID=A0E500_PARTE|nr:uncharacterized protein GSPATT00023544001 [Paramecium tetraurelia]CAK90367.1 unnamed protein product [Paramecium tetraurelia]|eukprot:XP_001457764.1 hypothetical protein (macronuclear) [Paramecium tetraurelia strain d4-2]